MKYLVWGHARAVTVSCVVMVSLVQSAAASIVFPVSGTSAAGNPVSFSATLAISGNTLTVQLDNTSPVNSTDAADVLTSVYFDILSGTNRPTLNYTSARGSLFLVQSGTTDLPYYYTPQTYTQVSGSVSDIRAVNNGDESWQFRTMNTGSAPQLGFGIGTVGNNSFSPNGFTPQIVGQGNTMINFAIYRGGDIDPIGALDDKYLVKNTATFTFAGLTGYTEANIVDKVVFGLGTQPDSTFTVSLPEPGTSALAAIGAVLIAAGRILRRARQRGWPANSGATPGPVGESFRLRVIRFRPDGPLGKRCSSPTPDNQRPILHERPDHSRHRPPDRGNQDLRTEGLSQATGRARAVQGHVHQLYSHRIREGRLRRG